VRPERSAVRMRQRWNFKTIHQQQGENRNKGAGKKPAPFLLIDFFLLHAMGMAAGSCERCRI